jgi:hypothetical protein
MALSPGSGGPTGDRLLAPFAIVAAIFCCFGIKAAAADRIGAKMLHDTFLR